MGSTRAEKSTGGTKTGNRFVWGALHSGGRRPICCPRARRPIGTAILAFALLLPGAVPSKELLTGTISDSKGGTIAFRLDGESREDVVGGRILLGDAEYTIARVSRLGLIGAHRLGGGEGEGEGEDVKRHAEYLVFSSSFSEQSATGTPWVAAKSAHGCDDTYNSFVAIYSVEGEETLIALGPIPYGVLAEDISRTKDSRVLCFMARPPK